MKLTFLIVHGSSPRVWGACDTARVWGGGNRFIPTCVGSISHSGSGRGMLSVHPHVCGEHKGFVLGVVPCDRFIPTCVGSMCSRLCL